MVSNRLTDVISKQQNKVLICTVRRTVFYFGTMFKSIPTFFLSPNLNGHCGRGSTTHDEPRGLSRGPKGITDSDRKTYTAVSFSKNLDTPPTPSEGIFCHVAPSEKVSNIGSHCVFESAKELSLPVRKQVATLPGHHKLVK